MFPGCQLAAPYDGWPDGVDQLFVEPKFDGYRLNAVIAFDGTVAFYCRDAEPVSWGENLEHIADELRALGLRSVMIDGEVMAEDWNATSRLLRRKRAKMSDELREKIRREVRLHVFDLVSLLARDSETITFKGSRKPVRVSKASLSERRLRLLSEVGDSAAVRVAPQFTARSEEQVQELFREMIEFGYEGVIVKYPRSPYVFGGRGHGWYKLKPHETREVRLVEVIPGTGKHQGRMGALACVGADGVKVRIGTGFTDAQREDIWARRFELIDAEVEMRAQAGSVATARHPTFVRIRTEKGVR